MILLACVDGGVICGPVALLCAGVVLVATKVKKAKAAKAKGGAA